MATGTRGRGVRIVVIDSGVHARHPHVQGVVGGVGIDAAGREQDDYVDRLGHGTAVTAAIREKAPEAEIFIARVFDRELKATAIALVAAIDWAIRHQAHFVNMSLGTTNPEHEERLRDAVARMREAGGRLVAAAPQGGVRWLPGALQGVAAVELDWSLPRDVVQLLVSGGEMRLRASGYPRPIPGVDPEKNLKGISFAVANATGMLARTPSLL
jgi:hypothetical protein